MASDSIQVVDLSGKGISKDETRKAAKWMAKAFANARMLSSIFVFENIADRICAAATPALTIFFGPDQYEQNVEMHEAFWASHINRVAHSGILLGAKEGDEWRGFRCFFEPGKGRQPYVTDFVGVLLDIVVKYRLTFDRDSMTTRIGIGFSTLPALTSTWGE